MKVIVAIDFGTTSNRVIAFSKGGDIVAQASYEFPQLFPRPGWVEHNPDDILKTMIAAFGEVVQKVGARNIDCIGITNQRETSVLWDRTTGKAICNAVVWQCRRTKDICEGLSRNAGLVKEKTGLFIDPYFSATKIKWMLDNVAAAKDALKKGRLAFGTVDSWALWNLTGGRVHATDASNASRTMCYNIKECCYDDQLLGIFGVPREILPEVKDSSGLFGYTDKAIAGREIPITGILGDQQASLFAHVGKSSGKIKNTYGTGLFLMMSTGRKLVPSGRLLNTIAWKIGSEVGYAIEGSVFVAGSGIQWLRDGLKIIEHARDTEAMALSLKSNEGVYFVPALAGMGAPYWDPSARGLIIGLARGHGREHIARAALESMAYQTRDVIEEMRKNIPTDHERLHADGGVARSNFLMQYQAGILDMPVVRSGIIETTAFGVAGIAGLHTGFWDHGEFLKAREAERVFEPEMNPHERDKYYNEWKRAVSRAVKWLEVC